MDLRCIDPQARRTKLLFQVIKAIINQIEIECVIANKGTNTEFSIRTYSTLLDMANKH